MEVGSLFSLVPFKGTLLPNDKPTPVQVIFKAKTEVNLMNCQYLRCQIIEPLTNEIIATLPVCMSARTVFSEYNILPVRDVNFGAMVVGSKRSQVIRVILENSCFFFLIVNFYLFLFVGSAFDFFLCWR